MGVFRAINIIIDIPYHFYDVNFACYYGVFEAFSTGSSFGNFVDNPKILLQNMIYNFGLMYNSMKDVIFYFINPEYSKATSTYQVGY